MIKVKRALKGFGMAVAMICLVVSAVYAGTTVCDNVVVANGMMIGYDDEGTPSSNTLLFYQDYENKIFFDGWDSYISGGRFASEDYLTLRADDYVYLENDAQECTFGNLGGSTDGVEVSVDGNIEMEAESADTKVKIGSDGDITFTFGNDD